MKDLSKIEKVVTFDANSHASGVVGSFKGQNDTNGISEGLEKFPVGKSELVYRGMGNGDTFSNKLALWATRDEMHTYACGFNKFMSTLGCTKKNAVEASKAAIGTVWEVEMEELDTAIGSDGLPYTPKNFKFTPIEAKKSNKK